MSITDLAELVYWHLVLDAEDQAEAVARISTLHTEAMRLAVEVFAGEPALVS